MENRHRGKNLNDLDERNEALYHNFKCSNYFFIVCCKPFKREKWSDFPGYQHRSLIFGRDSTSKNSLNLNISKKNHTLRTNHISKFQDSAVSVCFRIETNSRSMD